MRRLQCMSGQCQVRCDVTEVFLAEQANRAWATARSVVVSKQRCYAGDPGSIPRPGVYHCLVLTF